LFIYPESLLFDFTGDEFELPAFYVDFAGAIAALTFAGLPETERNGSIVNLSLSPDSSYPGLEFFDVERSFPLNASSETLNIITPRGAWVLTPHLNTGYLCSPTDTTLTSEFWLPSTSFAVTFLCTTSSNRWDVYGTLLNDLIDPTPVDLREFVAQLLTPDGTAVRHEALVDAEGHFVLANIPEGYANFTINNAFRNVFIFSRINTFYLARNTDIGAILVDNVSGYINVSFAGFERHQLPTYIECTSRMR